MVAAVTPHDTAPLMRQVWGTHLGSLFRKGKCVSAGLPEDISIPPPRPKRKPSHPYPRKPYAGGGASCSATPEGASSQV